LVYHWCGSGIGAGIARAALRGGERFVATARNLGKARNALRDMTGENLAFFQLDVTDESEANGAVEQAVNRFGRIDVAVNNAGYAVMGNFEVNGRFVLERYWLTAPSAVAIFGKMIRIPP